jgi:hypothetical protein
MSILPSTLVSRLLKSCAMPPVSWPQLFLGLQSLGDLAAQLLVLVFQLADMQHARRREVARRARLGDLQLGAQQFLADAAVLVLELLAPELRAHPRLQHFELAGFLDVVVGPGAETGEHGLPVFQRRQHDQRNVAHGRDQLDAAAGFLPAHAGHQQVEQDAVDGLHCE